MAVPLKFLGETQLQADNTFLGPIRVRAKTYIFAGVRAGTASNGNSLQRKLPGQSTWQTITEITGVTNTVYIVDESQEVRFGPVTGQYVSGNNLCYMSRDRTPRLEPQ